MSDIFVMVRSQANIALTSVAGIRFVAELRHHVFGSGVEVLATEVLDLIHADAGFDDLKPGNYSVVIRHERVEPPEATVEVSIDACDQVVLLTFVYLEAEQVLLRIQSKIEQRL
jgi:hypothetical protein